MSMCANNVTSNSGNTQISQRSAKNRQTISLQTNLADLYIRVSTTEQAEEGFSVEEQEVKLRAYCQAYNYEVNRVCIDPGFSGATMDRPALRELIDDVENGRCKKVLVWKLDRLSRSQKDTLVLLEDVFLANGCDFISLNESFDTSTPFGRCIVGILAAFAQMERENIKMRTCMGRAARIRKGYFSGSHCPIGYKFKEGTNELVIDPYASKLVQEAYELYLSGNGISTTGKMIFNKYGDTSYDWTKNSAVRRLLSNPVYMGKVRHNDEIYQGIHEPLVSEKNWYAAAARIDHNRAIDKRSYRFKVASNGLRTDNLLSGLLFCGDCGARMYARQISKNYKRYICHSVARSHPDMIKSDKCTNRLHPYTVKQLDAIILDEINKLSLDRSYFDSMVKECSEVQIDVSTVEERVDSINHQIDRLLNLYQTGLMSIDDISERLGMLKEEKTKLQATIKSLKAPTAPTPDETWEKIKDFSAVLESGDIDAIHAIVHSLIDKIVILNEDITIYWTFAT